MWLLRGLDVTSSRQKMPLRSLIIESQYVSFQVVDDSGFILYQRKTYADKPKRMMSRVICVVPLNSCSKHLNARMLQWGKQEAYCVDNLPDLPGSFVSV
jgi:hypothetical protein